MADEKTHPLVHALLRRDRLSDDEVRAIEGLPWRARKFEADEDIVREGSRPSESCLITDGLAAREQRLRNGRRQLTALHVAGDFVDLHGFLLRRMDHSVVALSPCSVTFVPFEALMRLTENSPHLTRLLWMLTAVDAAIQRTWTASVAGRPALERLAHLICEMFRRLEVVGLTTGNSFSLPLTQTELADLLGLSTVHTNRSLQELRGKGFVAWQRQVVTIADWDRLAKLADFDSTYLSLQTEPR